MAIVKLGDVVYRVKDFVDKDKTNLTVYVGGEHFDNRSLRVEKSGLIKGSTIGPAFHMKFKKGDVLLMSRNPHLRKAGMVDFDGICSDVSYVIRTKNEKIIRQDFIPLLFQSNAFWNFAEKNKKGSTNFFLNWSDFEKFTFNLPSYEEQTQICSLLWSIDKTRRSYSKMLINSDELIKAYFTELFGTPILNEKKWPIKTIKDVCLLVTDGSHFSPKGVESGYPMFSVKDMLEDGFSYEDCKYVTKEDFDYLEKNGCVPEVNDVLVAKDGSYFTRAFVIKEKKEEGILSSIALLRPNTNIINPTYLKYYLLSEPVVSLVEDKYVSGSALKRVIIKGIKLIPIFVPEKALQDRFEEKVLQIFESKASLNDQLCATNDIFENIINEKINA